MELLRPNETIQRNDNNSNNANNRNNQHLNNENNGINQNPNPFMNAQNNNNQNNNINENNIDINNINLNNFNYNRFHHFIHSHENEFLLNKTDPKSFYEIICSLIFSKKCYKISIAIVLFLLFWIIYLLHMMNYNNNFLLTKLESEENYFPIIIWMSVSIILILSWNFHLFIYTYIFRYDYLKTTNDNIRTSFVEECYKNPLVFILIMYYYDTDFLNNSIDNSLWVFVGCQYYFMNYHLKQYYIQFYNEINNLINCKVSFTTKKILQKINQITLLYLALGIELILFNFLILLSIDYMEKLILLSKNCYLIYNILELWKKSYDELKFIDFDMETKEKYFIKNLKIKSLIEFGGIFYIYLQFILIFIDGDCKSIYFNAAIIFCLIFLGVQVILYYKKYKEFMDYYNCLDTSLQKIQLNNEEGETQEECVICTEKISIARKLPCNHHFHLICLSKWFEKGHNSCPMCRAPINFDENINKKIFNRSIERNNQGVQIRTGGVFAFNFNLNNLLSWLPNFSLRIIRFNNNGGNIIIQNPNTNQINLNIRRRNININIAPRQNININPPQGNAFNNFAFVNNNINAMNNNNNINNINNFNDNINAAGEN